MFIDGEDGNLQYGHDEELHRAGFTQDSPEGDQDSRCAEVCIDYSTGKKKTTHFRWAAKVQQVTSFLGYRKQSLVEKSDTLEDVDFDLAVV